MKHRRRLVLVATLGTGVALTATCTPQAEPSARVVLITLDTLRLDSFLGGADGPGQMPRLRKWAERGRVFERYYSSTSSTQPTHATLLTGLHPWEHGVPRNGMVLTDERITLAERLRDAGFRTAAAVASFPLHSQFGFDQGFETYHDEFTEGDTERWGEKAVPAARFRSSAEDVTRTALAQLDAARGSKQFFWFHYFDAHAPWGGSSGSQMRLNVPKVKARIAGGADPERILAKARGLYDGDVSYLDAALDRVFVRLDDDREKIETHVVVVSDHGESFGEGGSVGHGKRLTPEQILVPCFVLSPLLTPGVSADPIGTTDLTTTILSLAGVVPEDDAPGGRDLLNSSAGPTRIVGMRRTFQMLFRETRVDGSVHVHEGPRFYVLDGHDLVTGSSTGTLALNDSSEEVTDPEGIAAARQLFAKFEEQFATVEPLVREDAETLEKLEALGYVR